MCVMHLNSTCNQHKSKETIFVEQREEKEVPKKSYGRGKGILPTILFLRLLPKLDEIFKGVISLSLEGRISHH